MKTLEELLEISNKNKLKEETELSKAYNEFKNEILTKWNEEVEKLGNDFKFPFTVTFRLPEILRNEIDLYETILRWIKEAIKDDDEEVYIMNHWMKEGHVKLIFNV